MKVRKPQLLHYDAILFDVDGTLIDSAPGILHTLEEVFQKMGVDVTGVNLRRYLGPPLRKSFGEHFTEPLSLPEVASHFGLSPQYFSTFFRENFGRTFTQHINSLRIEQAARLLRETDLPVMEVGFSVGFDNFSYFIKRFRSVYGVSPSHYRKG